MKFKYNYRLSVFILVLLTVLGIAGLLASTSPSLEEKAAQEAHATQLDLVGSYKAFQEPAFEAAENPYEKLEALADLGDLFAIRVSYPTGIFDPGWYLEAQPADALIADAIPAGRKTYSTTDNPSPLTLDPTAFTSLGPMPLQSDGCQSCFAFGHVAGRTNVIVSDPISPNIAYIGSDGGGVWKSTDCCDANTTWTSTMDDPLLNSIAIGDITLDPNDHDTVYAGTGDLRYGSWSFGSAGLLKSTNGAQTWEIKGADVFSPVYSQTAGVFPQYQAIGKVKVDPRDSDNVIVTTKQGVYFSYDAGDNWDGPCFTNSFSDQRQDGTGLLVKDTGSQTIVYVAIGTRGFNTTVQPDLDQNGANGIYTTTVPTSGCPANWNLITRVDNGWPAGTGEGNPYPANVLGRIDLAISPSDPNVIYAQVASIPTRGQLGVWKTEDGGARWEQRSNVTGLTGCFGDWPQNWYDQGLAVDPNDPNNVFMSTVDLFRSADGGAVFSNLTCGYAGAPDDVHVDHHALAFVAGSSNTLLVGTDGGVYVSNNADEANPVDVNFDQLNDTLNTIEFYSGDITGNFATSAQPGVNAGAQDNGSSVFVWDNIQPGPAMWQMTTGGDGMYARIEPIFGQRWYQESQNGNLKVSTTGPTGTYVSATGAWGGDRVSFVMPYEIYKYDCPGPDGCTHLIVGTHRVWETIQGAVPASSWYVNSGDLTKNTLGDRSFVNQLNYATSDSSIAIIGTNDGNVQYGFGLGQGTANSATWVNVTGGNAVLPNRPIMDVVTDPDIPLVGYASLGGFDQNTPATPGHVYQVTCQDASCASFTWENKSGNLPNIPANSIVVNPKFSDQVFVGTDWGLYFTNDINAASPIWFRFSEGLPSVMIWDMAIDHGFTTLALFTRARGAYVWPLPDSAYPVGLSDSFETDLPGTTVIHELTLTNFGAEDSFSLTLDGNSWPTTLLTSSPITVSSGATATVQVQVDIPAAAFGGTMDSFTVSGESVNDASVVFNGNGVTAATAVAGIEAPEMLSLSGAPGETVTYTVAVTNTGNTTDTFTLDVDTSEWAVQAPADTGEVSPDATVTVEVAVTIGIGTADSVALTFTSGVDTAITALVDLNTTAPAVAGIQAPTTLELSGAPGETVTYTVAVTNTGNTPDTYDIAVGSSVWTVQAPADTGEVSPGAAVAVEFAVTIGSGTTDSVAITFTSEVDPAVSAVVSLNTTAVVTDQYIYLPLITNDE